MLEGKNLNKSFREGDQEIAVLRGVHISIRPKQKIGIVGASGVGKSTLLHILGGLDQPTDGKVLVEGANLYGLSEAKRAGLRNRFFGMIFQFYHLLPELTVLENVAVPAWLAGMAKSRGLELAKEALGRVGLEARLGFAPSRLSGGEQQRAAIARALVLKPKIILADEPTGNLDQTTGEEVMRFLLEVVATTQGSLLLVTHNRELAKNLDEVWELKDGKLAPL